MVTTANRGHVLKTIAWIDSSDVVISLNPFVLSDYSFCSGGGNQKNSKSKIDNGAQHTLQCSRMTSPTTTSSNSHLIVQANPSSDGYGHKLNLVELLGQ